MCKLINFLFCSAESVSHPEHGAVNQESRSTCQPVCLSVVCLLCVFLNLIQRRNRQKLHNADKGCVSVENQYKGDGKLVYLTRKQSESQLGSINDSVPVMIYIRTLLSITSKKETTKQIGKRLNILLLRRIHKYTFTIFLKLLWLFINSNRRFVESLEM